MKILFTGAAGSVTGSSHLFEINGRKVLLDCGMYQGRDAKERGNDVFQFNPSEVDYLILSHAHIDHSGRIPLLYKQGFKGQILCTAPTLDLSAVMLEDSAKIQEQDAARINKKRLRQGKEEVQPLYTIIDAKETMKFFRAIDYNKKINIFDGMDLEFRDSGHMLGSAFTILDIKENGKEPIKVVYSGDVGNKNIPLLKDPDIIKETDLLLLEATYGNRLHTEATDERDKFISIINKTIKRGGNVIVPSFAVGRTQEIIYILNEYAENGKLDPNVKVFIDSPLASKATEVFRKYRGYLDEDAKKLMDLGDDVLDFKGLALVEDTEESIRLNDVRSGAVIISASGMADAGRVRHHLKHNLWRKECSVVFVGYQAEGTLGKDLISGDKSVSIMGEIINVEASIYQMNGLSGHADQKGLLDFVDNFDKKPRKIYLVHGDDDARMTLANELENRNLNTSLAKWMETVEINSKEDLDSPMEVIDKSLIKETTITDAMDESLNSGFTPMVTDEEGIDNKEITPNHKSHESSNPNNKRRSNRDRILTILNSKNVNKMSKEEILELLGKNL